VRITGGTLRSRRLDAPAGDRTRPTSDRVREALFSVLAHHVDLEGATVVDAFAGSGSLAFEAMSRGAERAFLLEEARAAVRVIEANAGALGLASRVSVIAGDAERGLARIQEPVRVLFVDPPYALVETAAFARFLEAAASRLRWEDDALVVVEHRAGDDVPDSEALEVVAERTWGDTSVRISRVKALPRHPVAP
jgi:16S rRNA (guanine966-N2)-methyltransferase